MAGSDDQFDDFLSFFEAGDARAPPPPPPPPARDGAPVVDIGLSSRSLAVGTVGRPPSGDDADGDIEEGVSLVPSPPQAMRRHRAVAYEKKETGLTGGTSSNGSSEDVQGAVGGGEEDVFHENGRPKLAGDRPRFVKPQDDKSSKSHRRGETEEDESSHDGKDGHGHAAEPTWISLASSAVVCFVIYFVFCIVFSSVVWDPLNSALDETINPPFGIPQGVGINLMGIAIGSLFFAWKSGCRAVMAGPDLLPVVFFAEAGVSVVTYLASRSAPPPCIPGALVGEGGGGHRSLFGEAPAAAFDDPNFDPCAPGAFGVRRRLAGGLDVFIDEESVAMIVPTTLVAMMVGNAITGLVFYGLGKMKNTASVIGFIPASVVAGFLTCIGYKVIKLAVLITTGYKFKEMYIRELGIDLYHANDPWLPLLIALIYGVLLYGIKRLHVVPAEKLILGFIAAPLVIFFAIVGITGVSMQELRETDWFLTQARDGRECTMNCAFTIVNFWQTLQIAYGSSGLVAWGAIPRCVPVFIMGACMTSLDNMLKLTSSEKALGVDLDYNSEMKTGGKATLVSSIFAGSPAYGQTKFNVMNLSIARTSGSPVPTLLLGALCLFVFLSGLAGPIINIMPRFLLGGLCVFAGVGFLYENLWEGRKNMNRVSFAIVWIIFLVNFIWEFFVLQNLPPEIQPMVPGLLVVFILGIVLSTFEFMFAFMHKATPPVVRCGDVCCSTAVRSEKHDNQLAVMAPWFQVFSVESFVFFGTANTLYQQLKAHLANQKTSKPKAERTKYLIFDLTAVTGIDSSAKNVFFKVHRLLKAEGISLVWAMDHRKLLKKFNAWGLFVGTTHYDSLDLALRHVEDELLHRASRLSELWLVNDTVRRIFERQVLANVFNISVRSDESNFSSARLRPWAQLLEIMAGEELCGPDDDNLYLLYSGEISIEQRDGSHCSVFTGSFFNLDRLLISVGALPGRPSTVSAVATEDTLLLAVSRANFVAMQKEDGALAQKLLMTLIVQNESNRPGRVRPPARARTSLTAGLNLDELNTSKHDNSNVVSRLLKGDDYKISLTDAQIERFGKLFEIILEPGEDEVPMDRFSSFVIQEARALGSSIEHDQFMAMIEASGIDEDGDGTLSQTEFLTFLRQLFLADIPSAEVSTLRKAYDAAVAEASGEAMDEARTLALFASLGFDTKNPGVADVIGVVDADGDGDVDFDEFMTGIGMMKQFVLLSKQLDEAFRHYKNQSSLAKRRASFAHPSTTAGKPSRFQSMTNVFASLNKGISQRKLSFAQADDSDDASSVHESLELDASDLEAFLKIERSVAEELVFLADQDEVEAVQNEEGSKSEAEVVCHRSIDRDEFHQLIRSWS